MTAGRVLLAVAAGLCLATLPFLHYGSLWRGQAHADHEPRHGGQLGMVGDHHIEIVRRDGRIEAFVSDARRRPERPREGWVAFDRGDAIRLEWQDDRLSAADHPGAREAEAIAVLDDGTRLALSFDLDD